MVNPRVLGHRGASGLAPENTLAAFRAAVDLGADGVELDIHTTADGSLVVHHDPVITGLGAIRTLRWEQIAGAHLACGATVPLLEEALATLAGLEVWIELKALPMEADAHLLEIIASSPSPDRCAIHSFDHRLVARIGRLSPALRRGVLSASYPLDPIAPVRAAGAAALWQEWHLIDADLVRRGHDAGIEIIAWTVNERRDAATLAGMEVDALCGNYPERLRLG
jgi:glycerophosphoryl diester phosphodiesterase